MKRKLNIKYKLIFAAFIHSVLLTAATFWLLERNFTYGDEKFLIKWSSIFKKIILGFDTKPPRSDFLFVNISYDNMLIDASDEDGFVIGNQVITDREKLAYLFAIINKFPNNHKYILCDIFFKDPSPFDSILQKEIGEVKNIIFPYHFVTKDSLESPIFEVNKGISDYNVIDDSFLKYKLIRNDSIKSIPLKMYEEINRAKVDNSGLITQFNSRWAFNTIIIDFKIRYFDILESKSDDPYPYVNLGEFITLPEDIIVETLKDKIICIGNLQNADFHKTIVGQMPGLLILINSYLTLVYKENIIYGFMIFILLLSYFLISIDIFSEKSITERELLKKLMQKKSGKFLVKFLSYVFYLTLTSLVIYFIYNIHINILVVAIYLKLLDSTLIKFRKDRRSKKNIVKDIFNTGKEIYKNIK